MDNYARGEFHHIPIILPRGVNYKEYFNKKIAVIHANCFGSAYKEYLNKSKDFKDMYALYPIPPIFLNKKGFIDDNLLKHCDLLITQDIRKENPYGSKLSLEYISSCTGKQCRIIIVPNLSKFGRAFFPYVKDKPVKREHASVFWGNSLIETYYQQGMNYEEIAEKLLDERLYDYGLIQKYFEEDIKNCRKGRRDGIL